MAWALLLAAVAAACLALPCLRALRTYLRFRAAELAIPGPLSLPLLGSLHVLAGYRKRFHDIVLKRTLELWGGRFHELYRLFMLNNLFVFVTDPDHLGSVMRDRRCDDKPWFMYSALESMIGAGIFTSNGERWRHHRTVMTPAFHSAVLVHFVDVFAEEAQDFANRLIPFTGRDYDCTEDVFKTTSIAAIKTILSSSIEGSDEADVDYIVDNAKRGLEIVSTRSWNPLLWPDAVFTRTKMGSDIRRFEEIITTLVERLIARKAEEIQSRKDDADLDLATKLGYREWKTFLDLLLEGTLSGRMDLTREALVTETRTMFAAAIDSPVIVITFVFKVLSILPDVQDRVHAELSDVLQGSDRPVTSEDMSKFAYMERVIKETMRLFPVAPLVARRVSEDMELAGKDIPAGTTLVLNLISTHRDPRHWPDPLGFDPDRFLPERAAAMHPYSYLPFSAGPRNCIGQVYAMMLLKTMLATMLRAYRVLPACDGITEPSQLPLTFDIMLRCVGGIRVRFEPRAAAA